MVITEYHVLLDLNLSEVNLIEWMLANVNKISCDFCPYCAKCKGNGDDVCNRLQSKIVSSKYPRNLC
jgi:hypothetical protein